MSSLGIFQREAINKVEGGRKHQGTGVSILEASSIWTVTSPRNVVRVGWIEKRSQNHNEGGQWRIAAGMGNSRRA